MSKNDGVETAASCAKPQFWQSSSTRTPGWNESPCARHEAFVFSNSAASSTLTSAGASRRSVAERLAETTTSSIEMPLCITSKFSSRVCPRSSVTFFSSTAYPSARTSSVSSPSGRFFRK